jgi:hypothetical protein
VYLRETKENIRLLGKPIDTTTGVGITP